MTIRTRTALDTNQAAAYPTRISNQRTLESALIVDILDSYLNFASTTKTADYTVIISTDSGTVFDIATDAKTFTLPPIVVGNSFTFINSGEDGAVLLEISPNANDGITYVGDSTVDKDLRNTKATANKGDFAVIQADLGDVDSWQVPVIRGLWVKE